VKDRVPHPRGGNVNHDGQTGGVQYAMEGSDDILTRRNDHDEGSGQTQHHSRDAELGEYSAPQAAYLLRAVLERLKGHHGGRDDADCAQRNSAPRR